MDLIGAARDVVLGIAAIAGGAAFVVLRRSRTHASRRSPDSDAPRPATTGSDRPPPELVGAWVQFVRDHIREAIGGLNNRFNAIGLTAESLRRGSLSEEQQDAVERIIQEIRRATDITVALAHRIASEAPETPPPAWRILQNAARRPGRILLADADESNRTVIARLLRGVGHEVTAVTDGREAWDVLTREPIDCVVCDPRMPSLGGRALYEQVEERLPQFARRFVFVSGDYTDAPTHAFLERSGQPVIGKPFELEGLLQAIATILHKAGVVSRDGE